MKMLWVCFFFFSFFPASLGMKEMTVFLGNEKKTTCNIHWLLSLAEAPALCTDLQSGQGARDIPRLAAEIIPAAPSCVCHELPCSSHCTAVSIRVTFVPWLYSVLRQRQEIINGKVHFLILTWGYVYWFEKETDREETEISVGCLPHVPWQGIESTTFWCTRQGSNKRSYPAGAIKCIFKFQILFHDPYFLSTLCKW